MNMFIHTHTKDINNPPNTWHLLKSNSYRISALNYKTKQKKNGIQKELHILSVTMFEIE